MVDFKMEGMRQGPGPAKKYTDFGGMEEEEVKDNKLIVTVVGDKGTGKTTFCLGQSGEIYAFTFDNKTQSIKRGLYNNDSRIHVIGGSKFLVETKEEVRDSSCKCYDYIMYCLGEIAKKGGCDWIVSDGLRDFAAYAEMKMRAANNIKASEGFANKNLWKERNLFVRDFHRKAIEVARKGVIYTTYFKLDEITIADGSTKTEKMPHYSDVVLKETDIVIFTKGERVDGKKVFVIECDSSKRPDIIKSGEYRNITDKVPDLVPTVQQKEVSKDV